MDLWGATDDDSKPALLLAEARSQLWSAGGDDVNSLLAAVRLARQVNLLQPDDVGAWMVVGVALFRLGRKEEAVDVFEEVRRLRPRHPRAHVWLRRALGDSGLAAQTITDAFASASAAAAAATTAAHAEGPDGASANGRGLGGAGSTAIFEGIRIEVGGGSHPGDAGNRGALTAAQACAAIVNGAAAVAAAQQQQESEPEQEQQDKEMYSSWSDQAKTVTSADEGERNDGESSRSSVARELKVRIKRQLHLTGSTSTKRHR